MMKTETRCRLLNNDGELIAEGPCWMDEGTDQATLEPERVPGVIQKQQGDLTLEFDSGQSVRVSSRAMIVRIQREDRASHRQLYRLRIIKNAQDANAAGAAGEGAPAAVRRPRENGETPAAR